MDFRHLLVADDADALNNFSVIRECRTVPREAVTRRHRVRVVIVVPALAEGQGATHQLLRESSRVSKRRGPMCVAS